MKLNQGERSVLAKRLTEKVQIQRRQEFDAAVKETDEKNIGTAKDIQETFKSLPLKTRQYMKAHMGGIPQIKAILIKLRPEKLQRFSFIDWKVCQQIEEELTIAQIDSPDVEVLKSRVARKFNI
jgi:hypothetical protein